MLMKSSVSDLGTCYLHCDLLLRLHVEVEVDFFPLSQDSPQLTRIQKLKLPSFAGFSVVLAAS